ncbi:hypothetical protein GC176_18455 [bacterium]|nr:hypothetical protein [bacterium]
MLDDLGCPLKNGRTLFNGLRQENHEFAGVFSFGIVINFRGDHPFGSRRVRFLDQVDALSGRCQFAKRPGILAVTRVQP